MKAQITGRKLVCHSCIGQTIHPKRCNDCKGRGYFITDAPLGMTPLTPLQCLSLLKAGRRALHQSPLNKDIVQCHKKLMLEF